MFQSLSLLTHGDITPDPVIQKDVDHLPRSCTRQVRRLVQRDLPVLVESDGVIPRAETDELTSRGRFAQLFPLARVPHGFKNRFWNPKTLPRVHVTPPRPPASPPRTPLHQ